MDFRPSRRRTRSSTRLTKLFCSASVVAMAAGGAASWAGEVVAQDEVPETVLITGSLIAGAVSVGVPVNSLRTLDFVETGQLSLTDVLKSIPSLDIDAQPSPTYGGGTLAFIQNVQIHSLGTGNGVETLLLVNGMRFPPQNYSGDSVNPSIIPQIAIERLDVLTAGASAVYGSDATAGVINIILRRGFDGAMTQVGVTSSPQVGYIHTQFAQLFGRTWETGNVTVSYTRTDAPPMRTEERSYYTQDFRPWGLQDSRPRGASLPGTVHVGNAISHDWPNDPNPSAFPTGGLTPTRPPAGLTNAAGTDWCAGSRSVPNPDFIDEDTTPDEDPTVTVIHQTYPLCYSIPGGQDGVGLTWADIVSNTGGNPTLQNIYNNWNYAHARPGVQWNQFHGTLDQRLSPNLFGFLGPVSFFAEGFYSNQRGKQTYPGGNGQARNSLRTNMQVPTNNPFYPVGAPSGLRVDYSFAREVEVLITGGEIAHRIAGGFNLDELPFDWTGKLTYSWTNDHNYGYADNAINPNNVSAALGRTVAASGDGLYQSYVKPDGIPYLNVFCDPTAFTCNEPATLKYITGYRYQDSEFKIQEIGANFNGPIFQLPGGPLEGAIAFQHLSYDWYYRNLQNDNSHDATRVVNQNLNTGIQTSYAIFGQLNIPVVGPEMGIPFVERFLIELGYRYDEYDNLEEPVWVRKVAANWTVGYGLTLRGAWGESFRVPSFNENSDRTRVAGLNPLGLASNTTDVAFLSCANAGIPGASPGVALPGSLTAELNPTCSTAEALRQPGAMSVELSGGGAAKILRGHGLSPQTLQQWSMGFNFAPTTGWLAGLNADVSWFRLEFRGLIDGVNLETTSPDDPRFRAQYTRIPRPDLPITAPENAEFLALVEALTFFPGSGGFAFDPEAIPEVKFIQDTALTNIGSRVFSGIDFVIRYDFELGDWGSFNVGAAGYYQLIDKSRATETSALDDQYQDQDSGNRLQRVRYRLGWANPTWNVTLFANYFGHAATGDDFGNNLNGVALVPPCFYEPDSGPAGCFPGSAYFGPQDVYNNMTPAVVHFDLTVGYQTGEMPANEWLRNIGIQFTINNIFDEPSPFQVGARGNGAIRAFNEGFSDLQRTFTLQLTKVW